MRQEAPDTKVILISAHGSIESAVAAMKLGGYDFIKKPFELEEIVAAVRNAARTRSLEQRVAYMTAQERKRTDGAAFVHARPAHGRALREVQVIAASPVPMVLDHGRERHGQAGRSRACCTTVRARAGGPFVELNCSAIPETLVESELFGHERGAFSDARERKLGLVEIADGGTLFLDEIGDLGLAAQAKLLTFLEQRTFRRVGATSVRRVDARVVAATNRNLVEHGRGARPCARTSSTDSTPSPSTCRRCANARRHSGAGRAFPGECSRVNWSPVQGLAPETLACWNGIAGQATCASCAP